MLHRIVTIFTILAVIACPMFCGEGAVCCFDQHDVRSVSSSSQQTCSCCCHQSAPLREVPSEAPERSDERCQGICGGGVMLESVKLDTRDDLLHAVPFEVVLAEGYLMTASFEELDEVASRPIVYGRSLRAWLSSYLC